MKGIPSRAAVRVFLLTVAAGIALGAYAHPRGVPYSLRPRTVQAFSNYVAKTDLQNTDSLGNGPFLWVDGLQDKDRVEAFAKLKTGEVEMRRLSVAGDGGNVEVPGGLIHDWEGIIFIPEAKLDQVLEILQDYEHHAAYYAPEVTKSRMESHTGDQYRVYMQFRQRRILTVVLNTEHQVTYYRDSPLRAHSRSSAVRIAQVDNPDGPEERERAPGEDDGFLWRMETWWRMEQRDGGVYVQNETVTLTRDIPIGLGWLVEPFITKIPEETLEFTLRATRNAVLRERKN